MPPTIRPSAQTSQGSSRVTGRVIITRMPPIAATDTAAKAMPIPCPTPNNAPSLRFVSSHSTPSTIVDGGLVPGMPRVRKMASLVIKSMTAAAPATPAKITQPRADGAMRNPSRGVGLRAASSPRLARPTAALALLLLFRAADAQ